MGLACGVAVLRAPPGGVMRSFAIVVMLVIGPLAACASDGAESADAIVDTCGAALSVDSPPI